MQVLQRPPFRHQHRRICTEMPGLWKTFRNPGMLTPAPPFRWCLIFRESVIFWDYAVFIVERWVPSRFFCCFIHRFLRLKPIARKNSSVRIFFLPVEKNLLNAKSFLISPKAPSTCIDRHILSNMPSSVVMFARDDARFSFSCFLTCNIFGLSTSLEEQHSDRLGQPVQSSHL